ncbi:kinase-like domain-containing protein [Syncephalis pseudoplumigaleata]|uniref:Kinase-like domain-containing protein n=1 Tax=Syncephalis pseudoplumigaleata TaxID=1712513 RepID=A0A4P9YRT8_9FUNG|nr:kinase-like domain-containing protein [Syncephalis pseudoplumigaleata]|eukprot:RKP22358.1 kinase-like domain-containing protein [Syncephalis pseudoplumigaleata]
MATLLAGGGSIRRKRNMKNLTLPNTPLFSLEIGLEFKLDLQAEDLQMIKELGAGNGGSVDKVLHAPTKTIMAKKNIHVETQPQVKKQILRELQVLHDCDSPYIVSFYGAFLNHGEICMCMEYMDIGSLDSIYRKKGPIDVEIVGKITYNVLSGLIYLYDNHRIIHRDIKPSNILLNSAGQIKICDFGVSGVLINSIASTFVGTNAYMSPERIQGGPYSVKSDVWSVGITVMELALGRFPFPPDGKQLAILELLNYIVNEPAPTLPEGMYPEDLSQFITACLLKNPDQRPTPAQLLESPFVARCQMAPVDLKQWAELVSRK